MENLEYTVSILDEYARTKSTMDLVPYSVTIPVIAAALMRSGYGKMSRKKQPVAQRKIVKYFFGTAFGLRYADGAPGKMEKDCEALYRWISDDEEPGPFETRIELDMESLMGIGRKSTGAVSLAMRCVYMGKGPKDFYDGGPVEPASSNLHHIFPLNRYKGKDVDSVLNLAFIKRSSNASIGDRSVEVYTEEIVDMNGENRFKDILESHLISGSTYECYRSGDYEGFIRGRFEEIVDHMRDTMGLNVQVVIRGDENGGRSSGTRQNTLL